MSDALFTPELRAMMQQAHEAIEAMIEAVTPPHLKGQGWQYRDVPWMTLPLWTHFIDIIGEPNVFVVAKSSRINGDTRGQLLVSPAGMKNVADYAAAKKAVTPDSGAPPASTTGAGK